MQELPNSVSEDWIEETKEEHYFKSYGHVIAGYGSSMDSHRCGDPDEPCKTIKYTRKVTPWMRVDGNG